MQRNIIHISLFFFHNATQISHNTIQGLETRLTFYTTHKEMANQKFGLKYRGYKPTGESTKSFCAHVCVGVALCIYLDGWRVARRTTVCVIKRFLLVFIKKSLFSRATKTECLEHGTIRSMVRKKNYLNVRSMLHNSNKSEQNLRSWSTCHYCSHYALVASGIGLRGLCTILLCTVV